MRRKSKEYKRNKYGRLSSLAAFHDPPRHGSAASGWFSVSRFSQVQFLVVALNMADTPPNASMRYQRFRSQTRKLLTSTRRSTNFSSRNSLRIVLLSGMLATRFNTSRTWSARKAATREWLCVCVATDIIHFVMPAFTQAFSNQSYPSLPRSRVSLAMRS